MQMTPERSSRRWRHWRWLLSFVGFSLLNANLLSPARAEGNVAEIKFTLWGSPFEKQALEEAVKSFNATHPTIHVTAQHTAYEAYGEKISAMLASGNPPDIAYLDYAQAFPFADAGKLLDLTPYFAKQPADKSLLESSYYHFDHGKKVLGTGLATGIDERMAGREAGRLSSRISRSDC